MQCLNRNNDRQKDIIIGYNYSSLFWNVKSRIISGVGRLHPDQVALVPIHKTVQHLSGR